MRALDHVLGALQDTADDLNVGGDELGMRIADALESLHAHLNRRRAEEYADLLGEQDAASDTERPY